MIGLFAEILVPPSSNGSLEIDLDWSNRVWTAL